MNNTGQRKPVFNQSIPLGKTLQRLTDMVLCFIRSTDGTQMKQFGDQTILVSPKSKVEKFPDLTWCKYDTDSGTIPPYSILQITGVDKDTETRLVRRPNADNLSQVVFTDSPCTIAYDSDQPSIGMSMNWFRGGIKVKYLKSAGAPVIGEEVGTVASQWYVKKGNYGLLVLGIDPTDDGEGRGLVWVRPFRAGPRLSYFAVRLWAKTGMISVLEECPDPTSETINPGSSESTQLRYLMSLSLYADSPRTYVPLNVLSQDDLYFGMVPNNAAFSGMPSSVRFGGSKVSTESSYYDSSEVRTNLDKVVSPGVITSGGIDNFTSILPEPDSIIFRNKYTRVFNGLGPACTESDGSPSYRPDLIRRPQAIIKRDDATIYDSITDNTEEIGTIHQNITVSGDHYKRRIYDESIFSSVNCSCNTSDFFFNIGGIVPGERIYFQFKMLKESSVQKMHYANGGYISNTTETGKNYNLDLIAQLWDCRNIAADQKGILVTSVDVNESLSTDGDVLVSMEFTIPEDYTP